MTETLGKETIDMFNTSDTRGSQRSYGINYQRLGKELMSMDELSVMDGGKCILQLRGVRPFSVINTILLNTRTTNTSPTLIRKMPLTLRNSYPPN